MSHSRTDDEKKRDNIEGICEKDQLDRGGGDLGNEFPTFGASAGKFQGGVVANFGRPASIESGLGGNPDY